jgi:hypothetical protein
MGQETTCFASFGGQRVEGKALLETDVLVFRGRSRLSVPLGSIQSAEARDGGLHIVHAGGTVVLELGRRAETWAERIRSPRSLLDKLGIQPGARIGLKGSFEADFRAQLRERASLAGRSSRNLDLLLWSVEEQKELARFGAVRKSIADAGAIWVVYPKGKQHLREAEVLASGRDVGLKDVKVARFSDTHTALKFVVPVADRKRRG